MGVFRKNNGAISIFLVIVLVPMLVLASIFVDMGRVKLGKAMAESAGDLTANTALTNYDAVLKDMYGLFAMSQTEKELYDNLEEYYKECIKAAGIGEVEADDYVGNILKLLKEEAGDDDLMNLSVKDDSFKFTQEETGTLANPALLKSQIVDFMKYRAPINLGTSIIDAMKCLDGVQEQTETVEKKNEFYEKQTDMMEKLEKAWSYIEDYEYRDYFQDPHMGVDADWTFPNGKLLESMIRNLRVGAMLNLVEGVKNTAAFLYYVDENYDKWNGKEEDFYFIKQEESKEEGIEKIISYHDFTGHQVEHKLVKKEFGDDEPEKNSETVITAIKNCFQKIEQANLDIYHNENAVDSDYRNTVGLVLTFDNKSLLSTSDKIRLVSRVSSVKYSILEKYTDLLDGLCDLYNLYYSGDYDKEFKETYIGITTDQNGAAKIVSSEKPTAAIQNTAKEFAEQYLTKFFDNDITLKEKFYAYNLTVKWISLFKIETSPIVEAAKESVNNRVKYTYDYAKDTFTFLDDKERKLRSAQKILEEVENDLTNSDSSYNKALEAWKESAQNISGSSMGDADLSEIESLSKVLTEEKLSTLKDRIDEAYEEIKGWKQSVFECSFNMKPWHTLLEEENAVGYQVLIDLIKQKAFYTNIDYSSRLDSIDIRIREEGDLEERIINGKTALYDVKSYDHIIGDIEKGFEYDNYYFDYTQPLHFLIKPSDSLMSEVRVREFSIEYLKDPKIKNPDLEKYTGDLYIWMYNNFVPGDTKTEKTEALAQKYEARAGNTETGQFDNPVKNENTTESGEIKEADDKGVDESEPSKKSDEHIANKKKEYNNPTGSSTNPNRPIDKITLPSKDTEYHAILNATVNQTDDDEDDEDKKESSLDDVNKDNVFSQMADSFSSLSKVIDLVKNLSTELRDDLYITNYIMEMFSYSTMEPEISVNNGKKFPGAWYTSGEGGIYNPDTSKVTDAMLKDATTLTLVEISPNFNYLYGQEVEYIIHGGSGSGAVAKTDLTIFGLRFALDLVYAFTDAEVVNLALSTATALFGVPPLTPLIPVAKLAIIIGLAIAEATYDLVELKQGNGIPLVKSSETFVMKPSNALKKAASEVATVVVDKGVDVLNKVITMTDEELDKFLQENEDAMKDLATSSVNHAVSSLQNEANKAVEEAFSICYEINEEFKNDLTFVQGQSEDKIKEAEKRLDAWLEEQKATDNTLVYEAKKTAVNLLKENGGKYIGDLFDYLKNAGEKAISQAEEGTKEAIGTALDNIREKVNKAVTDAIESAGSALSDIKNQVRDELKEAVKNGGEELKNKLREQIGNSISEGADSAGTNSIVGSLLNWQYSDYLQLFVLIGLIANPEAILLRVADCIELNRRQINNDTFTQVITTTKTVTTTKSRFFGLYKKTETKTETNTEEVEGDASFKMRNAYVYLTLEADVEVKPLLLNLPLIRNYTGRDAGGDFFNIKYKMTQGY